MFSLALAGGAVFAQSADRLPDADLLTKLLSSGYSNLGNGAWAAAESDFDEVLKIAPDSPSGLYGAALAKFNLGKTVDAESCVNRALAVLDKGGNKDAITDCLVLRAVVMAKKGDNGAAVKDLERAVNLRPENFDAMFSLGRAYAGNGDLKSAVTAFRKASAIRSWDLRPKFLLATSLENLGETEEALLVYRAIVKSNPDSVEGNLGLGVLLVKTEGDDSNDGLASLRKVLEIEPKTYEARLALGKALSRRKKYEEAIGHLKVAASVRPDNPEPFYQLAIAYGRLGMKTEADEANKRVREIHAARRGDGKQM